MRGIEGALAVLDEVEKGAFAAEALRRVWADVSPSERKLAATLVYITLRRLGLWKHILGKYCRKPLVSLHPQTVAALHLGIAGVLELRFFKPGVLVNALVQRVKRLEHAENGDSREHALVNAVLHTVMERAPAYIESLERAPALRDQALAFGVPGWVAAQWSRDWGTKEAKRLLPLSSMQTFMSLRVSPWADRASWIEENSSWGATESDFLASSVRLETNLHPPDLPGYREGEVTPQGESSIWAVESLLSHWNGDFLLDLCVGRGIKAGQILSLRKEARLEGWDLSGARIASAERELERLGVSGRARLAVGDALELSPGERPSAILLDAPCSGSGTWGRHPEGKWRCSPAKLKSAAELQERLFARAADMLQPGGVMMYCTCSLFKDENENVVGSVLARRDDLVELSSRIKLPMQRRGRPYGTVTMPELPWVDGFYTAIFKKKN